MSNNSPLVINKNIVRYSASGRKSYYPVNYQTKRAIHGVCGNNQNCAVKHAYGINNGPGCRVVCAQNNGVSCQQWSVYCTQEYCTGTPHLIQSQCNGNKCVASCSISSVGGAVTHIHVTGTYNA